MPVQATPTPTLSPPPSPRLSSSSSSSQSAEPLAPPYNRVFCPTISVDNLDNALKAACASAREYLPGVFGTLITRECAGLDALAHSATLYIVAHGSTTSAHFIAGNKRFTAKEVAHSLEQAGLKKDHQQLVLLVCHAGDTVGTMNDVMAFEKASTKVLKLKEDAAKHRMDVDKVQAHLTAEKQLKLGMSQWQPKNWTEVEAAFGSVTKARNAGYILPLAAQLVEELRRMGYGQIKVRAFNGEVSNIFSAGIMLEHRSVNPKTGESEMVSAPANASNTVNW